jgi:hypothetical protein
MVTITNACRNYRLINSQSGEADNPFGILLSGSVDASHNPSKTTSTTLGKLPLLGIREIATSGSLRLNP